MIITEQLLQAGFSYNGGLSDAQFRCLGTNSKSKGWKRRLIGKQISEENARRFVELRNAHLKKDTPQFTITNNHLTGFGFIFDPESNTWWNNHIGGGTGVLSICAETFRFSFINDSGEIGWQSAKSLVDPNQLRSLMKLLS